MGGVYLVIILVGIMLAFLWSFLPSQQEMLTTITEGIQKNFNIEKQLQCSVSYPQPTSNLHREELENPRATSTYKDTVDKLVEEYEHVQYVGKILKVIANPDGGHSMDLFRFDGIAIRDDDEVFLYALHETEKKVGRIMVVWLTEATKSNYE